MTEPSSILTPLREAQSSASQRGETVEGAILTPKEWLTLHAERAAEGGKVAAGEASALVLFLGDTKVSVEFESEKERQAFRALYIIWSQFGQVCEKFELCAHDSCRASVGAWAAAEEALQLYR